MPSPSPGSAAGMLAAAADAPAVVITLRLIPPSFWLPADPRRGLIMEGSPAASPSPEPLP